MFGYKMTEKKQKQAGKSGKNDDRTQRIAELVWKLWREDLRRENERRGSLRRN